jgi:DNA invertase Pin-like site-specific DNA recombinase
MSNLRFRKTARAKSDDGSASSLSEQTPLFPVSTIPKKQTRLEKSLSKMQATPVREKGYRATPMPEDISEFSDDSEQRYNVVARKVSGGINKSITNVGESSKNPFKTASKPPAKQITAKQTVTKSLTEKGIHIRFGADNIKLSSMNLQEGSNNSELSDISVADKKRIRDLIDFSESSDESDESDNSDMSEDEVIRPAKKAKIPNGFYEINKIIKIDHYTKQILVSWIGSTRNSWIRFADATPEFQKELEGMFNQPDRILSVDYADGSVRCSLKHNRTQVAHFPPEAIDDRDMKKLAKKLLGYEIVDVQLFNPTGCKFQCKITTYDDISEPTDDDMKNKIVWIPLSKMPSGQVRTELEYVVKSLLGDNYMNYGKPGYTPPTDPMAIIYLRRSTDPSARVEKFWPELSGMYNPTSMDDQHKSCTEWCKYLKIKKTITIGEEGVSARYMSQAKLCLIRSLIVRRNITLVCFDASRLSRNKKKAMQFIKSLHNRGCRLSVALSNASSDDAIHGMPIIEKQLDEAQVYSDAISRKTIDSRNRRIAQGKITTNGRCGFKPNDDRTELVPNYAEIGVFRLIVILTHAPKLMESIDDVPSVYNSLCAPNRRATNVPNTLAHNKRLCIAISRLLSQNDIKLRGRMSHGTVKGVIERVNYKSDSINEYL